ncbi:hypothetical protein FVE85_6429 [Porphyridium purpureum]|uniref:Uncharacterized protein n=1 Tax=Porphyridium purpureum TaxID=35688 RepID=A0A5J4Z762_PORPP|nr:hypothetical protein FVE85_6429 [Porphyridium purpureum]|eukprot:POR1524..scf295_1
MAGVLGRWGSVVRAGAQASRAPRAQIQVQSRRNMAGGGDHGHEKISWADYRAGKYTLQEWQDANRPIIVGIVFAASALLYVVLKPKKKQAPPTSE